MFSLNSIVNLNTRVMVITMLHVFKARIKVHDNKMGVAHNISCIKCVYYTGGR